MKIGIHQGYMFPYRGYFQLIASVDKFVLYDDAQYIKAGFVNRNYFPKLFTFRLKKAPYYYKINERYFLDIEDDKKRFKRVTGLHSPIIDRVLNTMQQNYNLSYNIYLTIKEICKVLKIDTPIYFSSKIPHGTFVQGILDIVKFLGGDTYVNLPGGKQLYNQSQFGDIKLEFIETQPGNSILCSL